MVSVVVYGIPVDGKTRAGWAGIWRISSLIAAPFKDFLKPEIVTDFFALWVKHIPVAIKDHTVIQTLALLDDLFHSGQRRREVRHLNQMATIPLDQRPVMQ